MVGAPGGVFWLDDEAEDAACQLSEGWAFAWANGGMGVGSDCWNDAMASEQKNDTEVLIAVGVTETDE